MILHAHFREKKRVQLSKWRLEIEEESHPWHADKQPLVEQGKENSLLTRWCRSMEGGGNNAKATYCTLATWPGSPLFLHNPRTKVLLWQIETLSGWADLPQVTGWYESWNQNWAETKCPKPHNSWIPILPVSFPDSKVSKVSLRQAWGTRGEQKENRGKKRKKRKKRQLVDLNKTQNIPSINQQS